MLYISLASHTDAGACISGQTLFVVTTTLLVIMNVIALSHFPSHRFRLGFSNSILMAPVVVSILMLSSLFVYPTISSSSVPTDVLKTNLTLLCNTTLSPTSCESVKLGISININPSILTTLLQSLQSSIFEATKLSSLLSTSSSGITEKQRGSLQDCQELHQITLSSLQKSASLIQANSKKLATVRTYLSAALTNKNTCLEGLDGASGPLKTTLLSSLISAYQYVSDSLSLVSKNTSGGRTHPGRRLYGGYPSWLRRRYRRLLQSNDIDGSDPGSILTVAADGSGNFTTISDAISFAPSKSDDRTIIIIKAGVYEENVNIPSSKTNIVLLGEGSNATVITGSRSVEDGWTTYRSATVAVSGQGFLARDIAFQNYAGAAKGQAVALRVNADLSAIYRCSIDGYQDTLYVHSFRQFYRECNIFGTVDFIFGNAAVVFQGCNIVAKMPLTGQYNVLTAQSRDDPNEDTGISIQNCTIVGTDELVNSTTKTYLGRPWKVYSTTVYIESYIDRLVDPAGWIQWSTDEGLDTLYYGEYMNTGPGSATDGRVNWSGFHVMGYEVATYFSVSDFIYGDEWLDSTSFPYDDTI